MTTTNTEFSNPSLYAYNPLTLNLSPLQGANVPTETSSPNTKPDITQQVRDLDTKVKNLLGERYKESVYIENINGHQGKAAVDILFLNYKQLMETARDPNLTEAKREELKGVIQDIRSLGASLDTSGWYKSEEGNKISHGLNRVADAFQGEFIAARLRTAMEKQKSYVNLILGSNYELTISNNVVTPQISKPGLKTLITDSDLKQKLDTADSWQKLLTIAQTQVEKLPVGKQKIDLQEYIKVINEAINQKAEQMQNPVQIQVPNSLTTEDIKKLTAKPNGSSGIL
jgi:hypothetical protein